ncbi:hypothetical protein CEP54_004720 [Fusarium duplospermum]|uniref:F-box domain-containing protein n=1 Tax=Fusarium duplospermum TaxID=1325734 RepID=A0A428QGP2_9HYPO|nr:hypothetical protein CEP54_004720 [Fusarium duplospermum]
MGLQDLCPEILFQICELFCEHCQGGGEWFGLDDPRKSLLALSLVCKSLGPIAQGVLHHHFGFGETTSKSIAQFCRTISNNPELAKALRWADLSSCMEETAPKDVVEGWLPETIKKFSHHLLDGGNGMRDKALLAAIILLQAPNLEYLEDGKGGCKSAFDVLSHGAVIRYHALPPNLKGLRLGSYTNAANLNDTTMIDLSWDRLGRFINALEKLEALVIHCPLASGVDQRLSFQSLRCLCLREFHMPLADLKNLISRIPNLEQFGIFRLPCHNYSMPTPATGPQILEALAQRNDTVRRLGLDMSCTHDDVKALRELTNLEELTMILGSSDHTPYGSHRRTDISKQALVSIMPPSLRKLHVFVLKKEGFEEASDALLTYIPSTYRQSPDDQRLQMVRIDLTHHPKDWSARQEDIIQQGCQQWANNGTLVFDTEGVQIESMPKRYRNLFG